MEPKYAYGRKVYIKRGFYRGYKADIISYEEVKTKNQKTDEEETVIIYKLRVDDVREKDQHIREDWLVPYRKYIVF